MCFSASASFTTSAVLVLTAVYTINKTLKTKDLSFILLAMMPLLFGIQQFSEGLIWVFLGTNKELDYLLSSVFLFFAFFLWPVYVPLALGVYEEAKKKIFFSLAFCGFVYGILLYGSTLLYNTWFHLHLCDKSVCYQIQHPLFNHWGISFYFVFTIFPFFIAKSNLIKILGLLIAISAIISGIFFIHAFTSVWCFFSAGISIYIGYLAYFFHKTKIAN